MAKPSGMVLSVKIHISQPKVTQPITAYKVKSTLFEPAFKVLLKLVPQLASPSFLIITSLYAPESFTSFAVPLSAMHTAPYEKVPSTV